MDEVEVYVFDRFELRPAARVVLADGEPVPLGGRAFDLLCALVRCRDRVIGKSELLDLVWPGRVVEENNLTVQVSALRKLIGHSAISTVAAYGYQFTWPVRVLPVELDGCGDTPAAARRPETAGWLEQGSTSADVDAALVCCAAGSSVILVATAQRTRQVMDLAEAALAAGLPMAFAGAVRRHGGRPMAGHDGACLAVFDDARAAAACALLLQQAVTQNVQPTDARLRGVQVALAPCRGSAPAQSTPVAASDVDVALDLVRLALPGQTLAAAAVREQLTDDLDCQIHDLGDLPLLQSATRVRVYQLLAANAPFAAPALLDAAAMKPLIAIVPFESRQTADVSLAIGELIADGLIGLFAHARHAWRVVSRLSATAFRGRRNLVADAQQHLGAAYVVSGSYVEQPSHLLVTLQVVDARSGEVARVLRLEGTVRDLLSLRSEMLDAMFLEVQQAVREVELRRVYSAPVPTLQSYTLLLGGIQLLHRSTPRDFDLSFRVLDQLVRSHPHALEPRVWQAKWYAMRAVQGQSTDQSADAKAALACTESALDIDPNNAFALAMEGFVHTHLTRDYGAARERLEDAIVQNDSETFAHLFRGVVLGITGEFTNGLVSYEVARSTSPHDPARYLMDSIGAYLYLGCGRLEPAMRLARESLRQNRNHAHTWRILTIAQQESGAHDEARQTMRRVLELQPDLTVRRYLAGARPGDPVRQRFAEALHTAGLPMH